MCPLKMEGMDEMNLFNYLIIINTNRKDILPKEKYTLHIFELLLIYRLSENFFIFYF